MVGIIPFLRVKPTSRRDRQPPGLVVWLRLETRGPLLAGVYAGLGIHLPNWLDSLALARRPHIQNRQYEPTRRLARHDNYLQIIGDLHTSVLRRKNVLSSAGPV